MFIFLQIIFDLTIGTILYTFFGYPVLVCLLAKLWPRPVKKADDYPTLSIIIAAYNEEAVIQEKIENSLSLDYPPDLLEIVVVADGSDDATVEMAQPYTSTSRVRVYHQPERQGKAAAVNRIMPLIQNEIVVLTDANAMLDKGTLQAIARNFADPAVSGVAGEKRVIEGGEGLYWRYESQLKRCDSALSSVMGAAGELFAVRRAAFIPPAEDSIIEDFVMSLSLVGSGQRVVYEPDAVAREEPVSSLKGEWQRRARNAAGGFRSIERLLYLLHPRQGRVAWQYFSHRVLRWAVTPFLLPLAFLLNLALAKRPFYQLLLLGQIFFYLLAGWGGWRARQGARRGLPYTIFFFCFTNLAALAGFWRYLTNRQPVTWQKVR